MALLALSLGVGCAAPPNSFEILDYREAAQPKRYRETFEEAYYDVDAIGNLNLVLRRQAPVEPGKPQELTQVIHIRSFWNSMPGRTIAERTQINGQVSYLVFSGEAGAGFEGSGSVFFSKDWTGSLLIGTLDHATLKPKRRLAVGSEVFARADIKGNFKAKHDPRAVVRLMNDMQRLFGPLPPYVPPDEEAAKTSKRVGDSKLKRP